MTHSPKATGFVVVRYEQQRDGVPVFGSELRVLVRNEEGFPVALATSSLHDLGGFTVDPLLAGNPFDRLEEIAPDMTSYSETQIVIWAGVNGTAVQAVLAITFTADNYGNPEATPERWLYVADAATGTVLYRESLIVHADVTGRVQGNATPDYKADICSVHDVPRPMAHAALRVAGDQTTYYAEPNGDFSIPHEGADPVTVESLMSGAYFIVDNWVGDEDTLSPELTPGVPYTFTHNGDLGTGELLRSQVNCYIAANEIRAWVLAQNPDYPVICTQTGFPIRVNRTDHLCPCNAWCDGESVNFCQAGTSEPWTCPNTGWNCVLYHEYGHHVVSSASQSGECEYQEGMADSFAVLMQDDPNQAYGFHGDCNAGLRTANNDCQYSASGCSTCGDEPHDCGNLLSGCVWSTRNELILTEPVNYLSILSRLTVNSILLHTGTRIAPDILLVFLSLDDDDAWLLNGTPHRDEICAGFAAHGFDCPPVGSGLYVSPEGGLASTGAKGAAFAPAQVAYTLINLSDAAVTYAVGTPQSWVTLSSTGGTIDAHASVAVSVGIDQTKAALKDYGVHNATVTFTNATDGVGDTTRTVELTVAIARFSLEQHEPIGWTHDGQWAFGPPGSAGGTLGHPDPGGGASDDNVYGVNLSGDYSATPAGPYYLTTGEIGLGDTVNRRLRFKRWLNTDHWPYVTATVEASPNNVDWTLVWSDGGITITDHEWTTQTYELSPAIGVSSTVYVRWGYQVFPAARAYSGWNIDDIEFLGDAAGE